MSSNPFPNYEATKVLVIEDYEFNQEIIREMLKLFAIIPDFASTGEEGVQKASEKDYDLILMDIKLPGIDGFEASGQIKKRKKNARIVALTASVAVREDPRFVQSGIAATLIKPIEIKELREVLEAYLLPHH